MGYLFVVSPLLPAPTDSKSRSSTWSSAGPWADLSVPLRGNPWAQWGWGTVWHSRNSHEGKQPGHSPGFSHLLAG